MVDGSFDRTGQILIFSPLENVRTVGEIRWDCWISVFFGSGSFICVSHRMRFDSAPVLIERLKEL